MQPDMDNTPEGHLTPRQAELLYQALDTNVSTGAALEIGAYLGRSTVLLAKHPHISRLFSVDVWDHYRQPEAEYDHDPGIHQQYMANLAEYDVLDVVRPITAPSAVLLSGWGRRLKFVFIDGEHTYESVKQDLGWLFWLDPHGIAAIHDYDNWPEVKQAVDEFLADSPVYKVFAHEDNILILLKEGMG